MLTLRYYYRSQQNLQLALSTFICVHCIYQQCWALYAPLPSGGRQSKTAGWTTWTQWTDMETSDATHNPIINCQLSTTSLPLTCVWFFSLLCGKRSLRGHPPPIPPASRRDLLGRMAIHHLSLIIPTIPVIHYPLKSLSFRTEEVPEDEAQDRHEEDEQSPDDLVAGRDLAVDDVDEGVDVGDQNGHSADAEAGRVLHVIAEGGTTSRQQEREREQEEGKERAGHDFLWVKGNQGVWAARTLR